MYGSGRDDARSRKSVWFRGVAQVDNGENVVVYRQSVGLRLISSTGKAGQSKVLKVVKACFTRFVGGSSARTGCEG